MNDNDDKRQLIDRCVNLNLTTVNPIIDWTTEERNDYIEDRHIVCNPLYCMGFSRVGCVGCCLASKKQKAFEFEMFPKYKDMYLRGFQKMLDLRNFREKQGLAEYKMHFTSAKDIFRFYMEENQTFGQIDFDDYLQENTEGQNNV